MLKVTMKYLAQVLAVAAVIAGALLIAGFRSREAPAPLAVPAGAKAGDLTDMKACEYQPEGSKAKFSAECGTLTVPENWDKADARLIALPVVRIPASEDKAAEPVFYLQGGPGQSNFTWTPPDWLFENRDVVFVGYRGINGTVHLACPEFTGALKAHIGKDLFSEQARADYSASAQQCAARFQAEGIDLSGYTIPNVIRDVEAVRTALGYERINLLSESYGTRVAQIYAYTHPESLHRLVLIGVNTPGHFIWNPTVLDKLIAHMSDLCKQDKACSSRTSDLAQTMYTVNRTMPKRWLFFNIDADTIRLGTQFMFMENPNFAMISDIYLAAADGDPSGLAIANLMTAMSPIDKQIFGDLNSKAASVDREKYRGLESVSLGDSIMGAPMAEWIWPIAKDWPTPLIPAELREFQETNVEMLLINGTLDFSTPPTALDEAKPYYHKAQMVLLPEFSHVADVYGLQPEAFQRLVTTYYDTGVGDASQFVYQPLSFKPGMNLPLIAKVLVAVMIVVPALIILIIVLVVRRVRRRRSMAVPAAALSRAGIRA